MVSTTPALAAAPATPMIRLVLEKQPVIDAEYRCAQVAAAVALVPGADVRDRRRHQVPCKRALRVVDREAAHLHRREHWLDAPRAEALREKHRDARAQLKA